MAGFPSPTHAVACDLSSVASVDAAVETVKALGLPIDALIANAGIMALPELQLQQGLEAQFNTNHMGHFALVTGLLDQLAPTGRVVMLSSRAHFQAPKHGVDYDNVDGSKGYNSFRHYGQSKVANLMFARALNRRLPEGQVAIGLHPGVIPTNLARHMPGWIQRAFLVIRPLFFKTIPQGAATQTFAAFHPDAAAMGGAYLADSQVAKSSPPSQDQALQERLYAWSEQKLAELRAS